MQNCLCQKKISIYFFKNNIPFDIGLLSIDIDGMIIGYGKR